MVKNAFRTNREMFKLLNLVVLVVVVSAAQISFTFFRLAVA